MSTRNDVTAISRLAAQPTALAPRTNVQQVIAALGNAIVRSTEERDLAGVFEREVERLLSMRAVRLREIPARYQARLVTPTRTADSVVLGVPTADPRMQAVLEASCEPDRALDELDYQVLTSIAQLGGLVLEAARARSTVLHRQEDGAAPLIGATRVMQDLRNRIERVAETDFAIMIEGESGTGKELVARQIHELSRRRRGPFVAINCAAVVETLLEAELFGIEERTATGVRGRRGKFEHADGGTLFLDEISDLSVAAQAKLLRVIQDLTVERVGGIGPRQINTRIVAATNRPLSALVDRGLFRTDLFYRLSGVEIRVPPLRMRKGDILELTQYFLARHEGRGRLSMTPAAVDALIAYDWPGNVRELERMIEGAIATAESRQICVDDLPVSLRGGYGEHLVPSCQLGDSMRAWGSRYARLVLERNAGNKRRACEALDISYHTLNSYLSYQPGVARAARRVQG